VCAPRLHPLIRHLFYAPSLSLFRAAALGVSIAHRYMIGDNPASDIRGANDAGPGWSSMMVRTGNIPHSAHPREQPKYEVDSVVEAVAFILDEQRRIDAEGETRR
jgi:ribonucleotide monophosphatase NagD (HAD superfamily)